MEGAMEVDVEPREPDTTAGGNGNDPQRVPDLDPPVDEVLPESAEPKGRRYPSTVGGACYLLMVTVSVVGLGIVTRGDWRLGVRWIAAALFLAALTRLVLPAPQAGMLAVRRRSVDVVILAGVGVALWFLSASIPNQPLL
jgi:hypothetical protein